MVVHVLGSINTFASEGGISALGVDLKALILQVITFLLVFWILKRFAFEKVVRTLEERRDTIDKGVTLGRKMESEYAALEESIDKKLREARKRADGIVAKANQDAGEIIKEAELDASRRTDTLIADAQAHIEDDIKQARVELEKELLSLVAEATEVIIDEKLDTKKDNALLQKALSGVKSR